MKKLVSLWLALALVLTLSPAALSQALPEAPGEEFYTRGKDALVFLSYKEYERALELLAFDTKGEDAGDFRQRFLKYLEDNAKELFGATVQRDVSVAYRTAEGWTLAVPVLAPDTNEVETLLFLSEDGKTFYGYAITTWGKVLGELDKTSEYYWNIEYLRDKPLLLPDV